jgi:hypothetical protein
LKVIREYILLPTNLQTPHPDEKARGFTYNNSTFDKLFYNSYRIYHGFNSGYDLFNFNFVADFANLRYLQNRGRFAKHPLESQ